MNKKGFVCHLLVQCVLLHALVSASKINGLHAYYKSAAVNAKIGAKLEQRSQPTDNARYKIGFGIGDITGPSAEINMVSKTCLIELISERACSSARARACSFDA